MEWESLFIWVLEESLIEEKSALDLIIYSNVDPMHFSHVNTALSLFRLYYLTESESVLYLLYVFDSVFNTH